MSSPLQDRADSVEQSAPSGARLSSASEEIHRAGYNLKPHNRV